MPHKTKTGWKWANVKRKTKGELAKTVYGIWKKNGSKGSFSDFWHGKDTKESVDNDETGDNLVESIVWEMINQDCFSESKDWLIDQNPNLNDQQKIKMKEFF